KRLTKKSVRVERSEQRERRRNARPFDFSATRLRSGRTVGGFRDPRHALRIVENSPQDAHFALFELRAKEQPTQALHDRHRRTALVEIDVVERLRQMLEQVFKLLSRGN